MHLLAPSQQHYIMNRLLLCYNSSTPHIIIIATLTIIIGMCEVTTA